jgi:predicted nucleic acid binding AN1-type Zn finger protein
MTATALQFDFDFDAPARRLPVRHATALTLVSSDSPVAAGRGLTLDDVLVERWERLRAGRSAGCLVCGQPTTAPGACGSCGSTLA